MGLFRTLLSPEKVRSYIEGKSRGVGYVLAVLLGAVTPFCSCSSVPLFIGFLEGGIPVGVTMAFLITSPLVNEVAVVLLASLMGWTMTAVYVGVGLGVGMLGGVLIDRFRMERYVEDYVWQIRMGAIARGEVDSSLKGRVQYAWGEVREIVGRVGLYVIVGIDIGSVLHGYVPQDVFAEYASTDNPFAVPLAVLIGLPLYSNATGIIAVAEALMIKGVPIGTVIAFMMSVVAISPPEFIILRKVLKLQMLVFFGGLPEYRLCGDRLSAQHAIPLTKENIMKSIKVLGSGCKNCVATAKLIEEKAKALGVEVEIEKVTDIAGIMSYGVMSTPGIVLDGSVVHAGGVPRPEAVEKWLSPTAKETNHRQH